MENGKFSTRTLHEHLVLEAESDAGCGIDAASQHGRSGAAESMMMRGIYPALTLSTVPVAQEALAELSGEL